jgi:aryl-alcohol dehydrogenase-like predicted oxidoreductase
MMARDRYLEQGVIISMSGTVRLGQFTVNRLGFGTMQLSGPGVWGPPDDPEAAIAVLRRAVALGVDFIDTADSYGPHVTEELIRQALSPYPEHLRIGTKAGFARTGPDAWVALGRPEYLRQQCEMSLRRLGVERIDVFQLHRIDPTVPAADQFGLLKSLRDEGKIAEVGLSEVGVADLEAAQKVLAIVSVQNQYNLAQRGADDLLNHCTQHEIAFIPWFPLANGKLSRPDGPVDQVAQQLGATMSQVALAWLLHRSPVMLPIPGTSSLSHLEENYAALTLTLSEEQFTELDNARKNLRRWALAG